MRVAADLVTMRVRVRVRVRVGVRVAADRAETPCEDRAGVVDGVKSHLARVRVRVRVGVRVRVRARVRVSSGWAYAAPVRTIAKEQQAVPQRVAHLVGGRVR